MLIEVHPQSPVSIYEQIVAQVIFGVAADALVPGTLIPSVRDLAQRLLVHPNTVAKAYQELERPGAASAWKSRPTPRSSAGRSGRRSSVPGSVTPSAPRCPAPCPRTRFGGWSRTN